MDCKQGYGFGLQAGGGVEYGWVKARSMVGLKRRSMDWGSGRGEGVWIV